MNLKAALSKRTNPCHINVMDIGITPDTKREKNIQFIAERKHPWKIQK